MDLSEYDLCILIRALRGQLRKLESEFNAGQTLGYEMAACGNLLDRIREEQAARESAGPA